MVHPGFAYYPYPDVDPYQDEVYDDDPYHPETGRHPIYEVAGLYADAAAYDDSLVYDDGYYDEEGYDLYDDSLAYDPYAAWNEYIQEWGGSRSPKRVDGVVFAAVALVLFGLVSLLLNRGMATVQTAVTTFSQPVQVTPAANVPAPVPMAPAAPPSIPANIFHAPYDSYVLTQGLHGYSYGHMAIDIKAGEGATIKSPIGGVVSDLFVDGLGNTTLVIENDYYQVMFLHGLYTVAAGDQVQLGQAIGTESNQGNTVDWAGNSCRGRNCGHHTHLNVFDKRLGQNVDPLALIESFAGR